MLLNRFTEGLTEAGCDEAGRGCLAGPVVAAAVILPQGYTNGELNDSKLLTARQRNRLREQIEHDALAWAVAFIDSVTIDEINILQASILGMHKALDQLSVRPDLLLIDGNRFNPYKGIRHECIVKGDGKYLSIAAASVLAKTHRDEWMAGLHEQYPLYGWKRNKGYPTREHRLSIATYGTTPYHRMSFSMAKQLHIELD